MHLSSLHGYNIFVDMSKHASRKKSIPAASITLSHDEVSQRNRNLKLLLVYVLIYIYIHTQIVDRAQSDTPIFQIQALSSMGYHYCYMGTAQMNMLCVPLVWNGNLSCTLITNSLLYTPIHGEISRNTVFHFVAYALRTQATI